MRSILSTVGVAALLAAPSSGFAQVTLVPYGAGDYRYQVVAGSFPPGVESPTYDDSGWPTGPAPFGNGGCGFAIGTSWPPGTNLVARKHLTLAGDPAGARVFFAIDNDVTIFINGVQVASVVHENCARYDEFSYPIPDGVLHAGDNVVAALAVDRGGVSTFDMRITANPEPCVPSGPITLAVGFENDFLNCGSGPVAQDVRCELMALDGSFAPRIEDCVLVDYFATGLSPGYLDGLAVRFDLSQLGGAQGISSLTMRMYVRKGSYSDAAWHAVRLYPGLFNTEDQDCDGQSCWGLADEFPGDPGWEGWVERSVPVGWLSGGTLDATIRIWNAAVDALELVVDRTTRSESTSWGTLKARYR